MYSTFLGSIKRDVREFDGDWMSLSELMRRFSVALRQGSSTEEIAAHLVPLLEKCVQFAETYDIDLEDAWERWKKKALSKRYF